MSGIRIFNAFELKHATEAEGMSDIHLLTHSVLMQPVPWYIPWHNISSAHPRAVSYGDTAIVRYCATAELCALPLQKGTNKLES